MAGRRKTFPCGHLGKGKYCHRCAQESIEAEGELDARRDWQARVSAAPVSLDGIPRSVAEKILHTIAALNNGKSYVDFKGKRLRTMGQREVISVPIGRRYRLVCLEQDQGLTFLEVLTHEQYNNRLSSGGWTG